eukprot:m.191566 g.191566  ORF g.191566 m.191566 type:complete len:483 (+) comp10048_c3_seq1:1220-2668(+)
MEAAPSHQLFAVNGQHEKHPIGYFDLVAMADTKGFRVPLPASATKKDPMLDPRRMRRILAEDPEWNVPTVPSLVDICLMSIVRDFSARPILDKLPERYKQAAIDKLAVSLPLAITARLLEDNSYWQKCFAAKFTLEAAPTRKRPWKRMFFEWNVREIIEQFVPGQSSVAELHNLLTLCGPLVEELELRQLLPPIDRAPEIPEDAAAAAVAQADEVDDIAEDPNALVDHIDFSEILPKLPALRSLSLVYVVRDCGMNFKWSLFGMTRADAFALGAALRDFGHLESLTIHSSLLDDTKTRILMARLLENKTLQHLSLAHNTIGDKGARAIAKFVHLNTSLVTLNLCDNQIRATGAKAIAAAARDHPSLTTLNLRQNRLEDQGAKLLFEGLLGNKPLTALNIASNGIGRAAMSALCVLAQKHPALQHLDIACNEFGEEPGKMLLSAIEGNKVLLSMDIRLCKFATESELDINKILHRNVKALSKA